jgi:murein L,D-transpeptidase YafK
MTARILLAVVIFLSSQAWAGGLPQADSVLVKKSERKLYLIKNGKPFRQYKIALGDNPIGHKQEQGDFRTPEGTYVLDWRKKSGVHYKSIHISYPDRWDILSAKERGVHPGGMVMIHGLPTCRSWKGTCIQDVDWTSGCIAVTNQEIDEIWGSVKDGTPIEILP